MRIMKLALFMLWCCVSSPTTSLADSTPMPPPSVSEKEARSAFGSPESLTRLLETRWPIAAIRTFCIPERRHNNLYQNLVTDTKIVWRGTIHRNAKTGFNKIEWYATTKNGRVLEYSLGVERGKDFWLIEIGSEDRVQHHSPSYAPDPKHRCFVGHQ